MWFRAKQTHGAIDPSKYVMMSSTVSSKILQTMAQKEGFVFEETLTGFKWMANRGLELQKQGFTILFAFEGDVRKISKFTGEVEVNVYILL